MRTQTVGNVVVELDGDGGVHIWEPNRTDREPINLDATKFFANLVFNGLGAPPAPEPHWTDDPDGITLIVEAWPGSTGRVLVDGHEASGEAIVRLAAAGFLVALRLGMDAAKEVVAEKQATKKTSAAKKSAAKKKAAPKKRATKKSPAKKTATKKTTTKKAAKKKAATKKTVPRKKV